MAQHQAEQEQSPENSTHNLSEGEDVGAKLLLQHRYLSELMGGILPPLLEPSWGSRVLEIGWCVGGLAFEMAFRYPSLHITAIDRNTSAAEQTQALVRGLGNITIFVQDIHRLDDLEFA